MHRIRQGLVATIAAAALTGAAPAAAAAQPTPSGPGPTPSATGQVSTPGQGDRQPGLSDVLHGDGVVQTNQGPVRVAVQQGTASQVRGSSLTVKSKDGVTWTWTIGPDTKVMSKRSGLQPGRVTAGTPVLLGGTAQGTGTSATYTARIVLLNDDQATPSDSPQPPSTEPSAESTTG